MSYGPRKDLGTRYTCYVCGVSFYDMHRPTPGCPKCGADQRENPAATDTPRRGPKKTRPRKEPPPPRQVLDEMEEAEEEDDLAEDDDDFEEDELDDDDDDLPVALGKKTSTGEYEGGFTRSGYTFEEEDSDDDDDQDEEEEEEELDELDELDDWDE